MPTPIRVIVALNIVTLLAFTVFSPALPFAVAKPFPILMPLMSASFTPAAFGDALDARSKVSPQANATSLLLSRVLPHKRALSRDDYRRGMMENMNQLNSCSGRGCLSVVTSFGFFAQGLFKSFPSDKGLAFYNKNDAIETYLKDLVNATKKVMSWSYDLVQRDPVYGPLLGPTVYILKCLVDDLLNYVEDVSDAIINALIPELLQCQTMVQGTCSTGVLGDIAGLCWL